MTLTNVLRDADQKYTVHGFRSSFRDWVAEKMPTVSDAVAEAALTHTVPDKVDRAYKRTYFMQMRHRLLEDWSTYLLISAVPDENLLKPIDLFARAYNVLIYTYTIGI